MTHSTDKIGIIAGGGQLPVLLAQSCSAGKRPFFVLALEGHAEADALAPFPHDWTALGTVGRTTQLLKAHQCTHVVLAGTVTRPDVKSLKLDIKGSRLLPRIVRSMGKGDDSLFKVIVDQFEKDGFVVIGPDSLLDHLLAPAGTWGTVQSSPGDDRDIIRAQQVVEAIGKLDIGQGAVVCDELVIAVEAAEGTDKMLERCADLSVNIRGTAENRRGVLLKMPKPGQERRVDLPTIGPRTVEACARAGLSGIAVAAGGSLVLDLDTVVCLADRHGMFVKGV